MGPEGIPLTTELDTPAAAAPLPFDVPRAAPDHGRGPTRRGAKDHLVLAGMAIVAMGCILALSARHGPARASAQQMAVEQQVEGAIEKLAAPDGGTDPESCRAQAVIATFYCQAEQRQVPRHKLQCNPFVFQTPYRTPKPRPIKASAAALQPSAAVAEALAAAKTFTLQSILVGSHSRTAMISNNLLSKGQRIQGWTVVEIHPRQVELRWKDKICRLKMAE